VRDEGWRVHESCQTVDRGGGWIGVALAHAASVLQSRAQAAITIVVVAIGCAACAPPSLAAFPYTGDGTLAEPASWKLAPGHVPSNVFGLAWKFAATPAIPPAEPVEAESVKKNNSQQDELCGVTGMSLVDSHATFPAETGSCIAAGSPVKTAFEVTVGRPDVSIAELDSGIKWNDSGAMSSVRAKVLLNPGELPAPKVDLSTTFDSSTHVNCEAAHAASGGDYNKNGAYPGGTPGGSGPIPYDTIGQGAFNVLDYACDSRVANVVQHYAQCTNPPTTKECRNGPPGMLTPEDLIIAFSDGVDHDHNGYVNDIAGWNYVDNTNDPFDDVQYGHGTGEVQDSTSEANNSSGEVGSCPNCMVLPLRVGESFIADANRFAQATIYGTDRGVSIIQEALGTYNGPVFSRQAIDYAYNHGVTVIASAADEAAEHHNLPGAVAHTIVVNAVQGPASLGGVPVTNKPPSYLQIDGCTNFGTRIDLSVPATSCSSEATGKSAGVTGLLYSAALNACNAPLWGHCAGGGKLAPAKDCTRVDGSACPLSSDEVFQLMAAGNIAGTTVNGSSQLGSNAPSSGKAAADQGEGGQADDVNTALSPETACSVGMAPTCTDPNLNTTFAADQNGGVVGPLPDTFRYPSRKGFDEFFGYGRINAYKAVEAAAQGFVPPQADITSPEWFQQLDPGQSSFALEGYVNARTGYTCRVEIAPGAQPNNASTASSGDFAKVSSSYCDGKTEHSSSFRGLLANVGTAELKTMFPKENPSSFTGNENGGSAQTSNGRPNTLPYAFTVRVVVASAPGAPGPVMTGEDRRQMFLHRDADMLPGFPLEMHGDGDASPLLVDLAGKDSNQLIVGNSDGLIHAYQYDPSTHNVSELPGWPVHTDPLPLHTGGRAFTSGELSSAHYDPVLEAPAAGDLFGDGRKEIVVTDMQGNVYAWDASGKLVFHQSSNHSYSGAPLSGNPSWEAERYGTRQRTEVGFLTSPVLAKLGAGPGLDIIAAGEDRHVYAWHSDGSPVSGFPVLVEDPNKVASVSASSNQISFNTNVPAGQNKNEDQGKIVNTPAVAYLDGPSKPPSIIVGTNEEYLAGKGNEGEINSANTSAASLGAVGKAGLLTFANSRLYVIKPGGYSSEPSSAPTGGFSCASQKCTSSAFRSGWPVKIGLINAGLLPDVGEGINGSPIVAPVTCTEGGEGLKIGVTPDAGPGYVLNPNGSSCYGSSEGKYNVLAVEFAPGAGKTDTPAFPAVGEPSFGTLDGTTTSMFAPVAGLVRALDVVAPDYQKGGQDFTAAWSANTGKYQPGWPALNNDLSFITGQAIGDVTGEAPKQEVVAGTASLDVQAYGLEGGAASNAWPKLSGGWLVATPTLGSLGTIDSSAGAKKDVVTITREGTVSVYSTPASACSPSSWPNFHHDIANSGDYTRDAIAPGVPLGASISKGVLSWSAPGGDLMCGSAASYQIVTASNPITPQRFAKGVFLSGAPAPAVAGTTQSFKLPANTQTYVAIRAIDQAGNVGLPALVTFNPPRVLPELGRCVPAQSKTAEYRDRRCLREAAGRGRYMWLPGPGEASTFAGHFGSVTLESVHGTKLTCQGGSSSGEYTGPKTETVAITLTGCVKAAHPCQSSGAAAGEIATAALEGEFGFTPATKAAVGLDLRRAGGPIASFDCGSGPLALEGSVIAPFGKRGELNKMSPNFTLKYKAAAGKQAPEQFEGALKDVLLLGGEQAGLTATETIAGEEALEIKAKL
jgi:hypothetical protein